MSFNNFSHSDMEKQVYIVLGSLLDYSAHVNWEDWSTT